MVRNGWLISWLWTRAARLIFKSSGFQWVSIDFSTGFEAIAFSTVIKMHDPPYVLVFIDALVRSVRQFFQHVDNAIFNCRMANTFLVATSTQVSGSNIILICHPTFEILNILYTHGISFDLRSKHLYQVDTRFAVCMTFVFSSSTFNQLNVRRHTHDIPLVIHLIQHLDSSCDIRLFANVNDNYYYYYYY